jgi:transglutaminase-like putative cysteine protease
MDSNPGEKSMRLVRRTLILLLIVSALVPAIGLADKYDPKTLLSTAPESSQYPNAGFINLIDEARYVIKDDGSWVQTTRVTAKICNERGRDIANVHLPYNSAFEKIKILRARTIKKDGTVVNVKSEDIREISPYSGYAMYSSFKAKVMIMPAVEDDCIIDYEWQVSGKHTIMPTHFWSSWYYQSPEPTMLSRFTLEVPTKFPFKSVSYNTRIAPDVSTSKDAKKKTYVWEGTNFGDIDPEPFMPSLAEICPWFELSSVNSWAEVALWYWKLVEPQMKRTPEIERAVAGLIKERRTDAEKAKAIYYWVEDKIRYVGLEFGESAYEPHSASDVFVNRYGDCKDQATLLITMLKAAGIKAYPALVPVGFRGPTSKRLPSPGMFNHAIAVAEIDGKLVWLDTTAEVCPFGDLPEPDRGSEVLVIKGTGGEFIRTPEYTAEENGASQNSKIELRTDGGIKASVYWTPRGSADLGARGTYKYAKPNKIKEGFEATVASISPDAKLGNFSVNDPAKKDEPMKISYDFAAGGWANRAGKFLVFRPSLYQSVLSQTPFSKAERKYDVCFYGTSSDVSETEIKLPDGCKVEEVPQNVSLRADFGAYDRSYALNGDTLKVTETLIRSDARVPVERYKDVKKFFEDVIQAQKQQVVLRLEG